MMRAGTPSSPTSCSSAAMRIISMCPSSSCSVSASFSAPSAVLREWPTAVAALRVGHLGERLGEAHDALAAAAPVAAGCGRCDGLRQVFGIQPEPEVVGPRQVEQLADDAGVERCLAVRRDRLPEAPARREQVRLARDDDLRHVRNGDDARLERDLIFAQALRVAAAVQPLVVRCRSRRRLRRANPARPRSPRHARVAVHRVVDRLRVGERQRARDLLRRRRGDGPKIVSSSTPATRTGLRASARHARIVQQRRRRTRPRARPASRRACRRASSRCRRRAARARAACPRRCRTRG